MITTPKEYYSLYHRIQSENPPSIAVLLPSDEKIYEIDLNKREIETPEFLSVETDHDAEIVYFKVNRFYDFFDLTQTVCVVNYINAAGDERAYFVPFYDVETFAEEDKILFPWSISGEATKKAGTIKYSISFYKMENERKMLFNLNTLETKSKILHGINRNSQIEEENDYFGSHLDEIYARIAALEPTDIYWEES